MSRAGEDFGTHYTDEILCADAVNLQDIKKEVHKRDKEMELKKCATADWSPAAVKIEEGTGWESLWESTLVCGERCMTKTRWLVKALCRCNGEDHTSYH